MHDDEYEELTILCLCQAAIWRWASPECKGEFRLEKTREDTTRERGVGVVGLHPNYIIVK